MTEQTHIVGLKRRVMLSHEQSALGHPKIFGTQQEALQLPMFPITQAVARRHIV